MAWMSYGVKYTHLMTPPSDVRLARGKKENTEHSRVVGLDWGFVLAYFDKRGVSVSKKSHTRMSEGGYPGGRRRGKGG